MNDFQKRLDVYDIGQFHSMPPSMDGTLVFHAEHKLTDFPVPYPKVIVIHEQGEYEAYNLAHETLPFYSNTLRHPDNPEVIFRTQPLFTPENTGIDTWNARITLYHIREHDAVMIASITENVNTTWTEDIISDLYAQALMEHHLTPNHKRKCVEWDGQMQYTVKLEQNLNPIGESENVPG